MISGGLSFLCRFGERLAWISVVTGVWLMPRQAFAHVKWFCAIADVTQPPIALHDVLTPLFGGVCCLFLLLVFAGFLLDGHIARRWPRLGSSGQLHAGTEEKLVRLATGAYFLLLWDKGAVVLWERGGAILTPELMANIGWMGGLQFAIAVFVGWRKTCLLAAAGICVLYGYGIMQFGIFHMTDYVFFPGIAAYLALTSISAFGGPAPSHGFAARHRNSSLARRLGLRLASSPVSMAIRLRVPLLSGSLAFGLMWTAVEKFVYPEWTLDLVSRHPSIGLGLPWEFVVVVAGFVEFTLAFYFMTGRGLVRFGAVAYASVFIAAIPEFGHLDTVGHMPVVAILAVVFLHGASPLQRLMGIWQRRPIANAAAILALYAVTLIGFFGMYYGLQWAEYG